MGDLDCWGSGMGGHPCHPSAAFSTESLGRSGSRIRDGVGIVEPGFLK